jgi:GT2 family glycosyltransferase
MKVLIGITTQNRAAILPKAIQSALDQDYADKEVAVFDDASTDATPELRERFPQVRWYHVEEKQGYLPARNKLMKETDAELYFSLDDDAWFMQGDEITAGVKLLEERPEVAAVAYDILSPDRPQPTERGEPFPTHMYIGCGHLLRLSAAREIGYYTPSPGFYGSEEIDLCVQLLDRGHEIFYLPGVHVWHDKAVLARDRHAQLSSNVCNDLVFAYRRCPFPLVLWFIPGKAFGHLRNAYSKGTLRSCMKGFMMFLKSVQGVARTRKPVSRTAFREFFRRSHSAK